jgi:hypothetical protein
MRELSKTLIEMGSLDDAAALLQRTIEGCIRTHGELHDQTLRSKTWLAHLKRLKGDFRGAQIIDLDVLQRAVSREFDPRYIIEVKLHLLADAGGLKNWVEVMELSYGIMDEARASLPEDDELRLSLERKTRLKRLLLRGPKARQRQLRQMLRIVEDPIKSERLNRRIGRRLNKRNRPDL